MKLFCCGVFWLILRSFFVFKMALSFILQNLDAIPGLLASIEMKKMNVKENVKAAAFWVEKANAWATVARASLERRCLEIEETMDSIERKCVEGNATWSYRVQKKQLMDEIVVEVPVELWWIDTIDKNFSTLVEMEISYSSYKKVEDDGSYLSHMLLQFIDPSNFTKSDLFRAIRTHNLTFVNHYLLNKHLTCEECSDALDEAAAHGDVAVVRSLIADGRCLSGGFDGGEALNIASYSGNLSVVESLLADPRVSLLTCGISPLCLSHPSCLSRLLQDPRFDSYDLNGLFMNVVAQGNIDALDILIKARDSSGSPHVDPTIGNNYPINLAVQTSCLAAVNRLLEDPRVDSSANNNYALSLALFYYHYVRVRGYTGLAGSCGEIVDRLLKEPKVQQELRKRYSQHIIEKIEAGYLPNVLRAYHKLDRIKIW